MNFGMCTAVGLEVTTIMQEEANQKTVCLVVTATKMTGSTIAKGIDRQKQRSGTLGGTGMTTKEKIDAIFSDVYIDHFLRQTEEEQREQKSREQSR